MTAQRLTKRIDMALHIQELCAIHNITVKYQSLHEEEPRYYANIRNRTIQIRPTKNTGYYVSALHEIGHIVGERQGPSISTLTKELYAWIWARENAIVWTDTAERIMRQAMTSYGWTARQRDIWNRRFNHEGVTT